MIDTAKSHRRRLILLTLFFLIATGDFAKADDSSAWPTFSWDTVPVYIHFGKTSGSLTDDELKFVATTSNFVCFEHAHVSVDLATRTADIRWN